MPFMLLKVAFVLDLAGWNVSKHIMFVTKNSGWIFYNSVIVSTPKRRWLWGPARYGHATHYFNFAWYQSGSWLRLKLRWVNGPENRLNPQNSIMGRFSEASGCPLSFLFLIWTQEGLALSWAKVWQYGLKRWESQGWKCKFWCHFLTIMSEGEIYIPPGSQNTIEAEDQVSSSSGAKFEPKFGLGQKLS